MRLVADESVEGPTVYALRGDGHAVPFIAEASPAIERSEVLAICRREQAVLLAADKDLGELVFRNREPHFGVLLIRSSDDDPDRNAAIALAAVRHNGSELVGRFSVLAGGALRIRLSPQWPAS